MNRAKYSKLDADVRRILALGLCWIAALAHPPWVSALTARASSAEGDAVAASMAVDGNPQTRWSSTFSDFQWLELDFGESTLVAGLSISWENAFARSYTILVSTDAMDWKTVYQARHGHGGLEEIYFPPQTCRFVRIVCEERGTAWGCSIWEVVPKTAAEGILITASSAVSAHPPADILDGSPVSFWSSDSADTNAWLEIGLPANTAVAGLRLFGSKCPATAITIATSADGKSWRRETVALRSDGDAILAPVALCGPVRARVMFDGCRGRLSEIELISLKEKLAMNGLDRARSIVGPDAGDVVTFVGKDGAFAPEPQPCQIAWCLQDNQSLYFPAATTSTWELLEGRYPVSIVRWETPDCRIATTVFAETGKEAKRLATFARTTIENRSGAEKHVLLHLLIQPCPLAGKWGTELKRVEFDGRQTVLVNGNALLWLSQQPATNAGAAILETAVGVERLRPGKSAEISPTVRGGYVTYAVTLEPAGTASFDVVAGPGNERVIADDLRELKFETQLRTAREYWQNRVPIALELPDRKYADAFYSSLYYLLIMQKQDMLFPGPYSYKSFFLHDAVEMNSALDCAGLHDTAAKVTAHFAYKEGGGYVDELGGSVYGLYEHYRFTRDEDYLARVYPRMIDGCRLIQKLRANPDTDDVACKGLLPKGVSQDNFKYPAHLYVDNWWALIGLKSGMAAAERLGQTNDLSWLSAEFKSLHESILESLRVAMQREKVPYMPGFADHWGPEYHVVDSDHRILGDTQMAWAHRSALFPGQSLGIQVPHDLFQKSYAHYWKNSGRFSGYDGGWFVEYEKLFWGYNVQLAIPMMYLGMGDVTLTNLAWSLRHETCPGGWSEAMTTRETSPGRWAVTDDAIIGDVPHGWTAAYYVLLVRNMLLREDGDKLVLLPCVPEPWLGAGQRIAVRNAATYFGPFGFSAESDAGGRMTTLTLQTSSAPPNGYELHLPGDWVISDVEIDGKTAAVTGSPGVLTLPATARVVQIRH